MTRDAVHGVRPEQFGVRVLTSLQTPASTTRVNRARFTHHLETLRSQA